MFYLLYVAKKFFQKVHFDQLLLFEAGVLEVLPEDVCLTEMFLFCFFKMKFCAWKEHQPPTTTGKRGRTIVDSFFSYSFIFACKRSEWMEKEHDWTEFIDDIWQKFDYGFLLKFYIGHFYNFREKVATADFWFLIWIFVHIMLNSNRITIIVIKVMSMHTFNWKGRELYKNKIIQRPRNVSTKNVSLWSWILWINLLINLIFFETIGNSWILIVDFSYGAAYADWRRHRDAHMEKLRAFLLHVVIYEVKTSKVLIKSFGNFQFLECKRQEFEKLITFVESQGVFRDMRPLLIS